MTATEVRTLLRQVWDIVLALAVGLAGLIGVIEHSTYYMTLACLLILMERQ